MRSLGQSLQLIEAKRLSNASLAVSGAKDFYLFNLGNMFYSLFVKDTNNGASKMAEQAFFKQFMRYCVEYYAVLIIILGSIVLLSVNFKLNEVLAVLGLYFVALFRLLPSLNRVLANVNEITFNYATFKLVVELLSKLKTKNKYLNDNVNDKRNNENCNWDRVEIENGSYSLTDDSKEHILSNVNFTLERGKRYLLTGPSGSGKSTLLDIILGLKELTAGKATFLNGSEIVEMQTIGNSAIAYVPQKTVFLNESIVANIALQDYFNDNVDQHRLDEVLRICEISEFAENLENDIDHVIHEGGNSLSGGQCQRIALARALYRCPELLILDEATSALDGNLEARVLKNIFEEQKSTCILMVSHNSTLSRFFTDEFKMELGSVIKVKR